MGSPSFELEIFADFSELEATLARLIYRAEFWRSSGAVDAVGELESGSWIADPELYTRPDRMRGGLGEPDRDGRRRDWGPGYLPYLRAHVDSETGELTLFSLRPHPPQLTPEGRAEVQRRMANFLLYREHWED